MRHHDRFFTLGVAYYPDYLYEGQLARLESGDIKPLTIAERIEVDCRRMRKIGLTAIRMGEFSWGHVEPLPGQLHTATFTLALDTALAHGLEVTMCTPTATPPKWLSDQHPEILPITRSGYTIGFGGRRQYDPTSQVYRAQSRRITEIYASAFGKHPAVTAWQTDNELANHSSAQCFTDAAAAGFRTWLEKAYSSDLARLNEEWFTCFWSHHYQSFASIDLPKTTWTDANPGLELSYRRYMSDAYRDFQAEQVDILRRLSPGRLLTHNITPMLFDVSLWDLCADLDVAGYDHYQMQATPNPASSASQYNLMRSLKEQRKFIVLEQQPVQVNWQPVNGRWGIDWLFLWGMQAALLGAEGMYYFSWQRFYGGSEQYHDGVVPHDLRIAQSRQEQVITAKGQVFKTWQDSFALTALPLPTTQVLIVHSMESLWAHDISAQSQLWDGVKLIEELQGPFLKHGIGVDMTASVAASQRSLAHYKLIILPGYAFELTQEERSLLTDFIATGGHVWSLPRTAVKDRAGRMSPFPLSLFERDDFYFDEYGGLLEGETETIALADGLNYGRGKIWAEKVVVQNHQRWQTIAHYAGGLYAGSPAIIQTRPEHAAGRYTHFTFWPVMDAAMADYVVQLFAVTPKLSADFAAEVHTYAFAQGTRQFVAAVNFGSQAAQVWLPKVSADDGLIVGVRARLDAALRLHTQSDHLRSEAGQAKPWTLEAREVGFWEITRGQPPR